MRSLLSTIRQRTTNFFTLPLFFRDVLTTTWDLLTSFLYLPPPSVEGAILDVSCHNTALLTLAR